MIQNYAIIDYGQTLWYNSIANCSLSIFFLQYDDFWNDEVSKYVMYHY